jgi:hypothetical protein
MFLLATTSRPAVDHIVSCPMDIRVKRKWCEADSSPSSNANIKKELSCTFNPHVFMEPFEAEARLNNIYKFISYLKENTALQYYKDQLANAV